MLVVRWLRSQEKSKVEINQVISLQALNSNTKDVDLMQLDNVNATYLYNAFTTTNCYALLVKAVYAL
jgi:hypothetical protein